MLCFQILLRIGTFAPENGEGGGAGFGRAGATCHPSVYGPVGKSKLIHSILPQSCH